MLSFNSKTKDMKYVNKIFVFICSVSLLVVGCTKDFEELNRDKNQVTAAVYNPALSLTKAQLEYSGNSDFSYDTWRVNIIYSSTMIQQISSPSYYAGDKYTQNDAWSTALFDVAYQDQVKYIVDMMELVKNNPNLANLYQIGRIMRALIFHRVTDVYGDIPYSEAGFGYYNRTFTPKYDAQQSIYMDMLKELDEAAKALDANKTKPGTQDLIYGKTGIADQIGSWKKLAYSLMLRLGMRLTKVDAAAAKTWVEKAYAGGVMSSNLDNAYILHQDAGRPTVNRNSNIFFGENKDISAGAAFLSKTFVDFLKTNNDPRLQWMSQVKGAVANQITGSTNPVDQIGLPNGKDRAGGANDVSTDPNYPGSINNYSTIRPDILLRLNGPTFFVTYAQTELLLAEAAQRGWSVGANAQTHYNNGVTAAMKQLIQYNATAIVDDAAITAYLTAHPYNAATGMTQINTQYWVASFLDWYEAWANWRRTAIPALTPVNYPGNVTGGQIPRRMLYPAAESSANGANLQEAITRQGPNTFMTRVWWDKP